MYVIAPYSGFEYEIIRGKAEEISIDAAIQIIEHNTLPLRESSANAEKPDFWGIKEIVQRIRQQSEMNLKSNYSVPAYVLFFNSLSKSNFERFSDSQLVQRGIITLNVPRYRPVNCYLYG